MDETSFYQTTKPKYLFQLKENLELWILYFSITGLNPVTNHISIQTRSERNTTSSWFQWKLHLLEFALSWEGRSTSHLNFNLSWLYCFTVDEMKKKSLRMEHLCQFHKPESSNISFNSKVLHKFFINVCFTSNVISICSFHFSATQTSKCCAYLQPTAKVLFKKCKCPVDINQNSKVQEEAMQHHGASPVPACVPLTTEPFPGEVSVICWVTSLTGSCCTTLLNIQ